MRLFIGHIGIMCTVVGGLSIYTQDKMPREDQLFEQGGSIILTLIGVGLMFIGRKYLLALIGYSFSDDDSDD